MDTSDLETVVAALPEDAQARVSARNPVETLSFFGVASGMTVVDTLPGNPMVFRDPDRLSGAGRQSHRRGLFTGNVDFISAIFLLNPDRKTAGPLNGRQRPKAGATKKLTPLSAPFNLAT